MGRGSIRIVVWASTLTFTFRTCNWQLSTSRVQMLLLNDVRGLISYTLMTNGISWPPFGAVTKDRTPRGSPEGWRSQGGERKGGQGIRTPLMGCKCMGNEERGKGSWSGTLSLWARVKNSIATLTNLLWTIFWICACHLARHANLHWLTSKLIPCNSFIMENDGRVVSIEAAGSGASKEANERNSLNSWTKQIKYPFGIHATTMVQTLEKQ